MAVDAQVKRGRAELERWYRVELRPKVARAAQRWVIDATQVAAFELAMAELIREPRPVRALPPNPTGRSNE